MIALVWRDQNGYSVKIFDDEAEARLFFADTRVDADGYGTWEDGYWTAPSDTESCHVTRKIEFFLKDK